VRAPPRGNSENIDNPRTIDGAGRSAINEEPFNFNSRRATADLHCKNACISTDILRRVFRNLTDPVPYTFISVNRRNNEARAHITMLFRRFTVKNVNGTGSVKL